MAAYLVTQASGQQSQWVIRHLLADGVKVHAVVRDIEKAPSLLKEPGITLFQGESKNVEDIYKAAQGCGGAFLNTFPIPGLEAQQAKAITEACKMAGVETVVALTTSFTGDRSMWDDTASAEIGVRDYYLSKTAVEDTVRAAGLKNYTILRPAIIYQDYMAPGCHFNFPRLATHGEIDHAFNDGVRALHTDAHDVGKYAAAALQNPTKFGGQEIELGNEAPTVDEIRDIIVRATGRHVGVRRRTPAEEEEAKLTIFGQRFQLFPNTRDLSIGVLIAKDVQAKFGIPFTSLEATMEREKARIVETLPTL